MEGRALQLVIKHAHCAACKRGFQGTIESHLVAANVKLGAQVPQLPSVKQLPVPA
jgi:hypothetical protein